MRPRKPAPPVTTMRAPENGLEMVEIVMTDEKVSTFKLFADRPTKVTQIRLSCES
jgi:hypothetical protein